jgi:transcriptional regulator with XRE-family HTH domain
MPKADLRKVLAANVRYYRAGIGLSQEELARRAGLDRSYVSGIERGVRNPTLLTMQRLANVLKVSLLDLLGA